MRDTWGIFWRRALILLLVMIGQFVVFAGIHGAPLALQGLETAVFSWWHSEVRRA